MVDFTIVCLGTSFWVWLLYSRYYEALGWGQLVEWWKKSTANIKWLNGKPFSCQICMSFWISLNCVLIYYIFPEFISLSAVAFMAIVINELMKKLTTEYIKIN